jgi:diguanylate cyclase (GGDEF)-like protein
MAELERLNAEIVQLSRTDSLTGIANRRLMTERLAEASRVTTRYGSPLSVMLFDVDHFKSINDEYGHGVGDAVLVTLARLVQGCIRVTDLPARLGGDEFVVIMAGVAGDEAVAAGERLQVAVRAHPWTQLAPGLAVRITVGVADGTGEGEPEKILRRADDALYQGKRAGRDTVSVDRGGS